ncbi:hypothetical protein [Natronorarus salvus]|uniref:hypothetical protein n=1 Tax=Natronorarus salvus TaxID=3117733 RepID=UPI002F2640BF
MTESEVATAVREVLSTDADRFRERALSDAAVLTDEIAAGTFDNPQAIVGFEYEFYAADDETDALRRVPRRLLRYIGFEKELGLHNAEMTTSPQPLNPYGLRAQEMEIRARLSAALKCTRAEGIHLASDGIWTIPPTGETTREYLLDSVDDDGIRIATNMSDSARYHAMANAESSDAAMTLRAPHVTLEADTVMPESLITSIQPHYQVAQATALPIYFNYALRVAGPLVALGVNSPFFPPDLYDDVPAETIIEEAWMGNRIPVFETVLNPPTGEGKVRFPRDLSTVEEAVDRIVTDDAVVPMPISETGRFDDSFATFRRKHGTYWRWVRPVFDGATRSAANARIEFRPIAAQPTVRDSVAFLACFAGLLESLPNADHPVGDLEWEDARGNFESAVRDGLGATIRWITADGEETTSTEELYADLFVHAEDGLVRRGLSEADAARYLGPLRRRVKDGRSPAEWKRDRVSARVASGEEFAAAVTGMQGEYLEKQRATLVEGSFADWLE